MKKSNTPAAAADEQKAAQVNEQNNSERTPAQDQAVADLNAQQTGTDKPAEPTLEDLKKTAREKAQAVMAIMTEKPDDTDAIMTAQLESYKAAQAVQKFIAAEKAEAAKKELDEKVNNAYEVVTEKFNITRELLDEQLKDVAVVEQKDGKDVEVYKPSPLKAALQLIIGKPVVHAKEGQSGKSLVKDGAAPKGKIAEDILALYNEGNGLSASEIIKKGFARGTTHSVILAWKRANGKA